MNISKKIIQLKGFTLIELSVIIMVLLTLVGTTVIGAQAYQNWQAGLRAGESLKAVYQAQKLFLADNPTTSPASITSANIIANLPNNLTAIPTIEDLDGNTLAITFTVSPPTIAGNYDPTGAGDGLWDVGE